MKKIFMLVIILTTMLFGQARYNPYTTEGWDSPWGFTGQDTSIIPNWSSSLGYYGLGIMEINTNPGGWLNYNYWKIDSLLQALVVYTDTTQIIVRNDTLQLAENIARGLDSTYSSSWVDITPDSGIAYKEGRIWYDSTNKSYSAYVEEEDVTLNMGRELWVRGYNATGSTILNGSPVYAAPDNTYGGVFRLGSSSEDSTSQIIGIATHDIEDGTYGYVTTFGVVGGLNTSGLSLGTVYLSSLTGLTSTEPDAPNNSVKLGAIGLVDASNGVMFVEIPDFDNNNGIADIGFVDGTEVIAIAVISTAYQITNATGDLYQYNTDIGHDITLAGDSITVVDAGVYEFVLSFSFEGVNAAVYRFEIYQSNGTTKTLVPNANALRKTSSTDVGNSGFSVMVRSSAGDSFSFYVQNTATTGDLTMKSSTVSIIQVR